MLPHALALQLLVAEEEKDLDRTSLLASLGQSLTPSHLIHRCAISESAGCSVTTPGHVSDLTGLDPKKTGAWPAVQMGYPLPPGKRLSAFCIRASTTPTTWMEDTEARSSCSGSLRQDGREK